MRHSKCQVGVPNFKPLYPPGPIMPFVKGVSWSWVISITFKRHWLKSIGRLDLYILRIQLSSSNKSTPNLSCFLPIIFLKTWSCKDAVGIPSICAIVIIEAPSSTIRSVTSSSSCVQLPFFSKEFNWCLDHIPSTLTTPRNLSNVLGTPMRVFENVCCEVVRMAPWCTNVIHLSPGCIRPKGWAIIIMILKYAKTSYHPCP